jgi:hypothetical protein
MSDRPRQLYVALLLASLVVLQVRAEILQVCAGFRPFFHAPARVPYSWDMFAIRIDRCVITWDPPLLIDGDRVARWRDRAFSIEFDTVYNDSRYYMAAAWRGCANRTSPKTAAHLVCLTAEGKIHESTFACP